MAETGRHFSVRLRITTMSTLLLVVVLIGAVATLGALQRRALTGNLRDAIEQRSEDLAELLQSAPAAVAKGGEDTIAQVVDDSGVVIAASQGLAGRLPLAAPAGSTTPVWRTVGDLDAEGDRHLLLSRQVITPSGTVTLHVAGSLGDIDEAARSLRRVAAALVPLVAAFLASMTWWLVGRTLSPVESIRAEVAEIGGADLHRRVPQPRGADEIARLARTMNAMLDRLEAAHTAQDRFVSDASHELRTPLTRMRAELELAAASPQSTDAEETYASLLEEALDMQALVEELLELARTDRLRQERVDLDQVVLAEAQRIRDEGRCAVDTSRVAAVVIVGDRQRLHRAIGNVADNALRYAATRVTFSLVHSGGVAELVVSDDGAGIAAADIESIFKRFTRLDNARPRGGFGLGLPIARDIVERLGGTLGADTGAAGGRIVFLLPTSPLVSGVDNQITPRG